MIPTGRPVPDPFDQFIENVERRCKDLGIESHRELARRLKMAPTHLSRIMRKKSVPTLTMLARFAAALDTSAARLLMSARDYEDLELSQKIVRRAGELAQPHPMDALHPEIREYVKKIAAAPNEEAVRALVDEMRKKFPLQTKKRVGD